MYIVWVIKKGVTGLFVTDIFVTEWNMTYKARAVLNAGQL